MVLHCRFWCSTVRGETIRESRGDKYYYLELTIVISTFGSIIDVHSSNQQRATALL
jgi:hypothetical protein